MTDLERELDEYYGTLNEIRMGTGATPKPKPDALIYYEMTVELGIPLVSGGIMDQPHIWLQMIGVIRQRQSVWRDLISNATQSPSKSKPISSGF